MFRAMSSAQCHRRGRGADQSQEALLRTLTDCLLSKRYQRFLSVGPLLCSLGFINTPYFWYALIGGAVLLYGGYGLAYWSRT